jgi:hypothetical protein
MCGNPDDMGGAFTINGRPVTPKGELIFGDFFKKPETRHRRILRPSDRKPSLTPGNTSWPTACEHP